MRLDSFNDLLTLNAIAILEKTLENTASVMLKNKLLVFSAYQL